MPNYESQRSHMVASQLLASDVTDRRVLSAFASVGRERFVPAAKRSCAYADADIEIVHGRWLLAPRTFAKLLQLAEISSTDTVLDVGCLTGYSTAVLSLVAGHVFGLEQDSDLVRMASESIAATPGATVVQGSLVDGYRAAAPFDAIIVNGAIETAPVSLLAQLAEGGRLVAIVENGGVGRATLYLNEQGRAGQRVAFDTTVPVLAGFRQPVGFVF